MSAHGLEIRDSAPGDAESLHAVLDVVARERRFLGLVEAPSLDQVREFVTKVVAGGGFQLLGWEGPRLVGWCDVSRNPREGFRHNGVLGMGLLPGHRGRGHGRTLLSRALSRARDLGFTRIELEVFASNQAALALYTRFGFAREGTKVGARILDGRTDDVVLMALRAQGG